MSNDRITHARTRYAAVVSLQTALAKMATRAKAEVIAAENDEVADTVLGPVHVIRTAPAPKVDEDALVLWALDDQPHAVQQVHQMLPEHRARIVGDLDVIGGQVVFRSTGEPAPFATVSEEGKPVVTYPNSDARKHAVEWACAMVDDEHGEALLVELVALAAKEARK